MAVEDEAGHQRGVELEAGHTSLYPGSLSYIITWTRSPPVSSAPCARPAGRASPVCGEQGELILRVEYESHDYYLGLLTPFSWRTRRINTQGIRDNKSSDLLRRTLGLV